MSFAKSMMFTVTIKLNEVSMNNEALGKAVIELNGVWPSEDECKSNKIIHAYTQRRGELVRILTDNYGEIPKVQFQQRAKELGFVGGYRWGVVYRTKGKEPNLPSDTYVATCAYMQQLVCETNWLMAINFKITDQRYKPADTSYLNAPVTQAADDAADWYDYESHKAIRLPPVGVECEMMDGSGVFVKVCIIAEKDGFTFGWRIDGFHMVYFSDDMSELRPLDHATRKAELERKALIEQAKSACFAPHSQLTEATIKSLIDAGWRPAK